jgi:inhibitor of cysteine peptidase
MNTFSKLSSSLAALSFVFAGALTGCAGADASADPAAEEGLETAEEDLTAKSVKISEDDDGKTIEVTEGQSIALTLGQNASTGYSWRVTTQDADFAAPTVKHSSPSGRVGASGTTKFTWKTSGVAARSYDFKLIYQRPWAERNPPADRFSFTVRVVRKGAPEGSRCGGLANFRCAEGLDCVFGSPPPAAQSDHSGVCKKPVLSGATEGKMCGGFANIKCATGLTCKFGNPPSGAAADMSGVCKR